MSSLVASRRVIAIKSRVFLGSRPQEDSRHTEGQSDVQTGYYFGESGVGGHLNPSYSGCLNFPFRRLHAFWHVPRKVFVLWPEMEHFYGIACIYGVIGDVESEMKCWWAHSIERDSCTRSWKTVIQTVIINFTSIFLPLQIFNSRSIWATWLRTIRSWRTIRCSPCTGDWWLSTGVPPCDWTMHITASIRHR